MSDFKKLEVWRRRTPYRSMSVVSPGRFGDGSMSLCGQMMRAASSIPTNIVEGRAMQGSREFARFIGYSIASSSELEYHLIVARDVAAITVSDFHSLTSQLVEVRKMLFGLLRRLRSDEADRHTERSLRLQPEADS